jgi:hypothetical protein
VFLLERSFAAATWSRTQSLLDVKCHNTLLFQWPFKHTWCTVTHWYTCTVDDVLASCTSAEEMHTHGLILLEIVS